MRDASYVKTQRLNQIKKLIAENIKNGVDVKKLILWIETTQGLTKQKAREYVDIVVAAEGWIIVDDVIKSEV